MNAVGRRVRNDGPAIRNANRGESRDLIRANRFAEKIPIFKTFQRFARTASNLRFEIFSREEKAYTTTTKRKSLGELFWSQRKTFQAGGGYKNPIKTRKAISTTEIFPLWTPFVSAKRSSALEQGGVRFFSPVLVPRNAIRKKGFCSGTLHVLPFLTFFETDEANHPRNTPYQIPKIPGKEGETARKRSKNKITLRKGKKNKEFKKTRKRRRGLR